MQLNNYAVSLFATTMICGGIFAYAYSRRNARGALVLALLMLITMLYATAYALELMSSQLPEMLVWDRLAHLAIPLLGVLWLLFVLHYLGSSIWSKPLLIASLFLVPCISIVAVVTSNWHQMYYRSVELVLSGGIPMLALTLGPLYWLHVIYSYCMVVAGGVILVLELPRTNAYYKHQVVMLLLSAAAPAVAAGTFLLGYQIAPHLDTTPYAFALSGLFLTTALSRYQLLDLRPIARGTVFEAMHDGVLVFDAQCKLVDANRIAVALLQLDSGSMLGQSMEQLLKPWPRLLQFASGADGQQDLECLQEVPHWIETELISLRGTNGAIVGRVLLLREITLRKVAEQMQQQQALNELELRSIRTATGTLAHEINNPLTGVLLNLEMMRDEAVGGQEYSQIVRDTLAAAYRIRDAVQKMQSLKEADYKPYLSDRQILDLSD